MKTFLSFVAVCLLYSSYSQAYRIISEDVQEPKGTSNNGNANRNQILSGSYSIPINTRVSPECTMVLQQVAGSQIKYLDQQQAWLQQELVLNQQNRAVLLQIIQTSQQGMSAVQSDEEPKANPNQIVFGSYSIPINARVSPQCTLVLQQQAQSQIKYLNQQQAWLQQELALNQQNRAVLLQITQISQPEMNVVQSDEEPEEVESIQSNILVKATEAPNTAPQGIIPSIIKKTGDVAGDIFNTAGQLVKDDIDLKAALIGGTLGGAGRAAASALHTTGQVAAHAASNIEDGLKNIFNTFGK